MAHLALDLATKTGWACLINGVRHSGEWNCARRYDESLGTMFLKLEGHLHELEKQLDGAQWEVVIFERPHLRGAASIAVLGGLVTTLQRHIAAHHPTARILSVHTGELKKYVTGSGRGDKAAVIAHCNARWSALYPDGPTANDNVADARALLEFGLERSGAER